MKVMITVRGVDEELYRRIREQAVHQRKNVGELVNKMFDEYLSEVVR